jgi:hypothetical protein
VETLDVIRSEDISIDAVAFSLPAARTLSNAIRTYFDSFTGAATAGSVTDTIQGVFWQDQSYSYLYPPDGGDTKFHTITTKYLVYYN